MFGGLSRVLVWMGQHSNLAPGLTAFADGALLIKPFEALVRIRIDNPCLMDGVNYVERTLW